MTREKLTRLRDAFLSRYGSSAEFFGSALYDLTTIEHGKREDTSRLTIHIILTRDETKQDKEHLADFVATLLDEFDSFDLKSGESGGERYYEARREDGLLIRLTLKGKDDGAE